jgi:hypothetical protein
MQDEPHGICGQAAPQNPAAPRAGLSRRFGFLLKIKSGQDRNREGSVKAARLKLSLDKRRYCFRAEPEP